MLYDSSNRKSTRPAIHALSLLAASQLRAMHEQATAASRASFWPRTPPPLKPKWLTNSSWRAACRYPPARRM